MAEVQENNDYLLEIWSADPNILTTLGTSNVFTKTHILNANLWLARCEYASLETIKNALSAAAYKMLVVYYTEKSVYYSSNVADAKKGQKVVS
ncbi:MAG: hypothetical protein K0Q79_3169 [Flavipsychrobacter sp.]|jgi:hypothetical protein|nr:hypothetical protein [Flavipsychrobacter sp.]